MSGLRVAKVNRRLIIPVFALFITIFSMGVPGRLWAAAGMSAPVDMPAHCDECHNRVLMEEHKGRAGSDGKPMGCLTCHGDNVPRRVLDAVVGQKTNCDACHTVSSHEARHSPSGLDARCQTCHKPLLTDEHLRNPLTQAAGKTCKSCHSSPLAPVRRAINSKDTYCWSCHSQGHGTVIEDKPPDDLPLMPGFQWSAPEEAGIWAGEQWLPWEFAAGKIIFSNRVVGVTPVDVALFYRDKLTALGWVPGEAAQGDGFFRGEYVKDNRKLLIWSYGGPDHNGQPSVAEGSRVELIYVTLPK